MLLQYLSFSKKIYEYPTTINTVLTTNGVQATKNKYVLRSENDMLYLSEDGGKTYPNTISFTGTDKIDGAYIFTNGSILITKLNELWASTDKLTSVTQITIKDTDGSDYIPHTPVNAAYPGSYFYMLDVPNVQIVNGKEMLMWGNYANVSNGAAPINIYYCFDDISEVKIIYKFGQNEAWRDDGTFGGGSTGNLLGDATNTTIARHVHSSQYCNYNGKWYFCTGDITRTQGDEIHWFSAEYNSILDTWNIIKLISTDHNERFKSTGINCIGQFIYFGSDQTANTDLNEQGIFKAPIDTFTNKNTHTRIYDYGEFRSTEGMIYDHQQRTLISYTGGNYGHKNDILLLRIDGSESKEYLLDSSYNLHKLFNKDYNGNFMISTVLNSVPNQNKLFFNWY